MAHVVVEYVWDVQRAVAELAARGDTERAALVRERGEGSFLVEPAATRERTLALAERVRDELAATGEVSGLRYCVRTDYDPDWSRQHAAIRQAIADTEGEDDWARRAAALCNAFARHYLDHGARWDVPYHGDGRWPQTDAVNYADRVYLTAQALAGLFLVNGQILPPHRMAGIAQDGWRPRRVWPGEFVGREAWLALGLGRTLRQCGQGSLDRLVEAIERGGRGDN